MFLAGHNFLVTVTEDLCHKWPQLCSACSSPCPILIFLFNNLNWICNRSGKTGATSGTRTAYPCGSSCGIRVGQYIFLCLVFCLPLLVFWTFSVCRCIVCSSIYGFRSPFFYPQTLIYIIDCSFLLVCLTLSPINVVIIVVYDIKTDI